MLKILHFILLLLLLAGCGGQDSSTNPSNDHADFIQLSTNEAPIEQQESNQAKALLGKQDGLTHVYAVNSDKKMIVAFEIEHLKRFQLKDYEKKITKQIKKEFPNMEVTISTDKKIVIEVDQLEQKMNSDSMSKKELDKELKKLIKLSKEKT